MRLFDVHEPFETALDEDRRGSDGNNVVLWARLVGQSCFHDLTGSHQPNARIRIEPSRTGIRALKDVVYRNWKHDSDIHGSDENAYRKQKQPIISARGMT